MSLNAGDIKKIVRYTLNVPDQGIGCYECLDQIDQYAEKMLAGREIPEALRLVDTHLQDCPECKEEYEALLAAVKGLGEKS
jgi:hypothetical protein